MILYIGAEDRGFFVRETASLQKEKLEFIPNSTSIKHQIDEILRRTADYLIFDVEQYVDPASELAEEILRIQRAKNCTVIIYAPGYDRESWIIQELIGRGIRFYIFSGNMAEARKELERCLAGYYYDEVTPETRNESEQRPEKKNSIKIGVTGACGRIGTTTLALQFVKHLQFKGYRACYIEVNSTGFVLQHEKAFNVIHDEYLGKVSFENVDMYYKPENLLDVLKQDYDFFVYDFGTYTDTDFNKTSFLEKDIRIFVMGSKAAEMPYTNEVIRNEYYSEVEYVFNFISEREKPELLEYMEEKADHTFFTVYSPDQFEYVQNDIFDRILPVEDVSSTELTKKKKRLFGWGKKKKEKSGKGV